MLNIYYFTVVIIIYFYYKKYLFHFKYHQFNNSSANYNLYMDPITTITTNYFLIFNLSS